MFEESNTCGIRKKNFQLRFRLRKDFLITLAAILRNDLEHQTRWGLPLTSMQQVLLTLRSYATASFHQVIGDLSGMWYFAVFKVKHRVSRAISKHKRQFISFPLDFHETKRSFYDIAEFPCVPWTHVRIVCPDRNNAVAFIDRKKFYSVNVQAVCDRKALKAGFHMIADDHGSQIAERSAIVCDHMETHCDRLRSSAILRSYVYWYRYTSSSE